MASQTPTNDKSETIKSARIILFAQSLSVAASAAGLIGLIVAYKLLIKNTASAREATTRIPTIS